MTGQYEAMLAEVFFEAIRKGNMKLSATTEEHWVRLFLKARPVTGGPFVTVATKFIQTKPLEAEVVA